MTADHGVRARLQWKWVWITLGMFVVLYFIPMIAASSLRGEFADKIIGGWSFGGILVITGLTGYLSKGVTIWEPAVAGGLLTVLWYFVLQFMSANQGIAVKFDILQLIVVLGGIFGLSLLGAGIGEGIQNAAKNLKEPSEGTQKPQ